MLNISPSWTLIGLNLLMVVYTLWVLSLYRPLARKGYAIAAGLLAWLLALHIGLSEQSLFATDISGPAFLAIIVGAVAVVASLLMLIAPLRRLLFGLDQRQLLLLQGIRVFYGATFLMFASTGTLPQGFGVLDGYSHIGAGFLGLIAAFSIAAELQGSRRAWFANLFGLADILVVATTLALVLLPQIGPHHPMMYAVFLPAPLWLCFHLISIAQLLTERRPVKR